MFSLTSYYFFKFVTLLKQKMKSVTSCNQIYWNALVKTHKTKITKIPLKTKKRPHQRPTEHILK